MIMQFFREILIDNVNADTHQNQRDEPLDGKDLVLLLEEHRAENHAKYRIHETKYGNLACGIVLQQNTPQGVGNRRDERHIDE